MTATPKSTDGTSRTGRQVPAASRRFVGRLWTSMLRLVLRMRGTDATDTFPSGGCVVLAPHADDETLGCGASILRMTDAGQPVHIVFATDGRHSHRSERVTPESLAAIRREEAIAACAALGVPANHVSFLNIEDRRLDAHREAACGAVRSILRQIEPSLVLVCSGLDGHRDHQALNEIIREMVKAGHISCPVLEYPVWFWALRSWRRRADHGAPGACRAMWRQARTVLRLRPRLVRTEGLLDRKRAALRCHRSQMGIFPDEPGWSGMSAAFLSPFFGRHEMFFELDEDSLGAGSS